jgi:hypothetical protein
MNNPHWSNAAVAAVAKFFSPATDVRKRSFNSQKITTMTTMLETRHRA